MTQPITSPESNRILRASIWVAIGALIAAALVCVVWVLIGDENGIVGKAFMTILLLAGFAGVAILEANLAPRRPAWFALTSMVSWVLILLIGAFMIWMPTTGYYGIGAERFFKFLVIVLIIQAAVLHVRLFIKAYERHQTTFTTIVAYVTIGLVVILAIMLVLPIMTEEFIDYRALYWRVVVALAILAAVGTALLPLVNALFAPKKPRPVAPAAYYSPAPWRRSGRRSPTASRLCPRCPTARPTGTRTTRGIPPIRSPLARCRRMPRLPRLRPLGRLPRLPHSPRRLPRRSRPATRATRRRPRLLRFRPSSRRPRLTPGARAQPSRRCGRRCH